MAVDHFSESIYAAYGVFFPYLLTYSERNSRTSEAQGTSD